jgi:hypothetical protein
MYYYNHGQKLNFLEKIKTWVKTYLRIREGIGLSFSATKIETLLPFYSVIIFLNVFWKMTLSSLELRMDF